MTRNISTFIVHVTALKIQCTITEYLILTTDTDDSRKFSDKKKTDRLTYKQCTNFLVLIHRNFTNKKSELMLMRRATASV